MYNDVLSIRITSLYGSTPSSVAFECKTATFGTELQVSIGPRAHLWFCAFKTVCLAPELLVSLGPSPHLWLLHVKQRLLTRITSLYGYQTWPVVLCTYNCVLSFRITGLYGSPPTSVGFDCKTTTFGPVYKSLWEPELTCRLCIQNSVISSRITRLYGFQPSSVVLCIQNSAFRTRLTSLFEYQTSSVVLSTHNSVLSTRINRLYWFQPSPVVLCMQNSDFRTGITRLYGS